MSLYRQETLPVIHYPAKFGGQRKRVGGEMFINDILSFVKYQRNFPQENFLICLPPWMGGNEENVQFQSL